MKKQKQTIISFPGNEEVIKELKNISKKTERSISWHLRKAVELYVKYYDNI